MQQQLETLQQQTQVQETDILAKIFETKDPNAATFQILDTTNNRRRNVTFLREKRKPKGQDLSALEAKKQFRKKCARYTGAAVLATGGTAAIAFSTLMQFGPQFAMLASLNLPPVALAAVAVSGVAMVAAAAYVAYRTCKPAPVVMSDAAETSVIASPAIATNYSKFLPHVLATMGTGMVGFSALMQFSPKVALLMGLHLTPAALMSVAAVGVLLISASLYLACKPYAKSRVVATEVTASADAPVNTSYMQRLSQHSDCCLKLFKKPTTTSVATAQGNQVGGDPTRMAMDRV